MWINEPTAGSPRATPAGLAPAPRIFAAIAWIFAVALLPNHFWRAHWVTVAALTWWSFQCRLPWRRILRRICWLGPLIGLTALGLLGQPDWPARVTHLFIKAALSLWIMSLLMHVTPFNEFTSGLRQLHFPRVWVELLAFLFRYFAVLSDEWRRMQWARQARTFQRSHGGELFFLAHSLGCLFIRAYERAERVHQAMLARGHPVP